MEVRGDQSAILAVRANPFTHCTGMTGEIAVRSAALRTIRLLIACEQLAHSSRIETAMQQLAKPVIAKALRDIGQQPQMRAVRQLRDVANLTHYPSPASPGGISATTFLMPCRAILV